MTLVHLQQNVEQLTLFAKQHTLDATDFTVVVLCGSVALTLLLKVMNVVHQRTPFFLACLGGALDIRLRWHEIRGRCSKP
jgi:hypothetical protein